MKTIVQLTVTAFLLNVFFLAPGSIVFQVLAEDAPQFIYTCACGKKCDCNTVATKPGKCPCGKKLAKSNILKIEGDKAIVCDCGGGCVCDLSDSDSGNCSCDLPVGEVSLKGLYVCACGKDCTCNTVSDKPGKCPCGKELRKVE